MNLRELQPAKLPPMRGTGDVLMQPRVHPHRPKWWLKEKRPDGTWTRIAVYGRPVKRDKTGKWVAA